MKTSSEGNLSVLMVTRESAADRRYGLGKSLWPIVDELQSRGLRVRYLSQEDLSSQQKSWRAGCIAYLTQLPGLRHWPNRSALLAAWLERLQMGLLAARVAGKERFTHVHLHDPWIAAGFWLFKALYVRHDVGWGVTEHGFGSYGRATQEDGLIQGPRTQRILLRNESAVLSRADWVMAPTELALEQLGRDLDQPDCPSHWQRVPHARPDLKYWSRLDARQKLGWTEEALVILGIGRLVPLKRFDLLIKAFIDIAPRHTALRLCILGEGDRDALWTLLVTAGLADRAEIKAVDDVSPYLYASDIYVSTSSTESFGLANLEALVAGLPVICTRVGGVPEVIGASGYLIDVGCGRLKKILEDLIDSHEVRGRWRQKALQYAGQWPDVKEVANAYVAIYQQ